jgi:periplasmic divalent cation tolerance protein
LSTRNDNDLIVILCTAPDDAIADQLARGLVRERLAACVNAIPGLISVYRWKGSIEAESEVQLIIKTQRGRFDDVAAWLKANHPYEVPEIIALTAERASEEYLQWAVAETS